MINKIFLLILSSILLISCKVIPGQHAQEEPVIRIVDFSGKYKPINKYVPAYNSKLQQQKENQVLGLRPVGNPDEDISNQRISDKKEVTNNENDIFGNDFGPSKDALIESDDFGYREDEAAKVVYNETNNRAFEAQDEVKNIKEKNNKPKVYKTTNQKSVKGIFVQIGTFISKKRANDILQKGKKISPAFVKNVNIGDGKKINKVFLGPVKSKSEAIQLLREAKRQGFADAFVTKIK